MAHRKPQSQATLQRDCDTWNAANPIGTVVELRRDSGQVEIRRTAAAAEILSGHSAVIWLRGVSGCYLLDRVKRCSDQTQTPVDEAAT